MGARALKIFAREGGPTLGRTMLGIRDRDRKTSDFLMQMLERRKELADSSASKAEIAALKAGGKDEFSSNTLINLIASLKAKGDPVPTWTQLREIMESVRKAKGEGQDTTSSPLKVGELVGGKKPDDGSFNVITNPKWDYVGIREIKDPEKLREMADPSTPKSRRDILFGTPDETVQGQKQKMASDWIKEMENRKSKPKRGFVRTEKSPFVGKIRGYYEDGSYDDITDPTYQKPGKPEKPHRVTPAEYAAAIKAAKEEIGDNPTPPRLRVGIPSDRKKAAQMTKEWNDKIKKRATEILSGNVIPSKSGAGDAPDGRPAPAPTPPKAPSKGERKRKKK